MAEILMTPSAVRTDHRVSLPGSEWALWRRIGLRSAGFPAALVQRLSAPGCAAAAMELCAAEEALAAARASACTQLEALGKQEQGQDAERRKLLQKTWRAIREGKLPPALSVLAGESAAALAMAVDGLAAARRAYERSYEEAILQQSRELSELAKSERYRTAVLWQNRNVFHHDVVKSARNGAPESPRNKQQRHHERLLASYLQRYTVKNDTIGFFGPSGWARFVEDRPTNVRPGPELIGSRSVYLDAWCFEEVARMLERDPAVYPFLPPVRMPFVRLQGTFLALPMQSPVRLPPGRAALLAACDGARTAKEIAADLMRDPGLGFKEEREIYRLLEHLGSSGLIEWRFQVPVHPEAAQCLRRQIERIEDSRLRDAGLTALDELETLRRMVAAARDTEGLERVLAELESSFSRLTNASPNRNPGLTYGGRSLIFEESRRDVEVELGPEVHRAIFEPLEIILQSARWYTCEAARQANRALLQIYRGMSPHAGSPVEMIDFWARVQTLEPTSGWVEEARRGLHQRWQQILAVTPEQRRVHLRAAELREPVHAAFPAAAPAWPLARYHNPDIMIAASSADALLRGDFQLVLGELHVAACSLNVWALLSECQEQDEVFADFEADFPDPRAVFLEPRDMLIVTARTRRAYFSPKDVLISPLQGAIPLPGRMGLAMSELVLTQADGALRVTSRDGQLTFPLIDFIGDLLTSRLTTEFSLLDSRRHWPRITIDRMIVARECWSFAAAELEFARAAEGPERFLAAQRWARLHGLPPTVFVKTPVELKPFYADFDSPAYINLLAYAVRRTLETAGAPSIRFTEMLPGSQEVWLPDAEQQRYTSELRLTAVDLSAFAPRNQEAR